MHDFRGWAENFAQNHAGNVTNDRNKAESITAEKSRNAGDEARNPEEVFCRPIGGVEVIFTTDEEKAPGDQIDHKVANSNGKCEQEIFCFKNIFHHNQV